MGGEVLAAAGATPAAAEPKEQQCRFCLQGPRPDDPFLAPCRCTGSQRWVHRGCLGSWQWAVRDEPNSERAVRCGVCGAPYSCGLVGDGCKPKSSQLMLKSPCLPSAVSSGVGGILSAIALMLVLCSTEFLANPPDVPDLRAGIFLVATNQISGGIFERSVVLMVDHSQRGSTGYIVNKAWPNPKGLQVTSLPVEAWEVRSGSTALEPQLRAPCLKNTTAVGDEENELGTRVPLHKEVAEAWDGTGGPVMSRGHVAILYPGAGTARGETLEIRKGRVDAGGAAPPHAAGDARQGLRLHGYAGWAPRQLESEIARGSWHLVNATHDMVFRGDPSTLWRRLTDGLKRGEEPQKAPDIASSVATKTGQRQWALPS